MRNIKRSFPIDKATMSPGLPSSAKFEYKIIDFLSSDIRRWLILMIKFSGYE